ncbi:MAG: DUF262 domain-containing protein [Clostridia bacterium]|nr:DUF262 domain-containing protein [Clostridia bacterium]
MKIIDILAQIDAEQYALPEFQRGYVWNREQVKKLANSLYKGYPIGGILIWVTENDESYTRGNVDKINRTIRLILDGQQRLTTLYGLIRGKAPSFFEGDEKAFTNLFFNLESESFEFYAPIKMKDDPNWIDVTNVLTHNASTFIEQSGNPGYYIKYLTKLNNLYNNITQKELPIEEVVGEDKSLDVVVEIFNNLNSGGTKLSKGDLALAKICAQWPDARREMRNILERLRNAGYDFKLEWLLRCITVYLTNKAYFSELEQVKIEDFKNALKDVEKKIDEILNQIGSRLGLDNTRVLGSKFAIPLMIGYMKKVNHKLSDSEWNKLLYWYIHTFLWGRYAGATESTLAQDLAIVNNGDGIDGLINQLRLNRGDLTIKPEDFWGWGSGARFYPLLYLLTRMNKARDFSSGIELRDNLLGRNSTLEVHHIFPRAVLYKAGKAKAIVNSLANYTFLTKDTNLEISDDEPAIYIPKYMSKQPGAIESHWIPTNDIELFKIDNYEKFLEKRRELLAQTANEFLNSLINDSKQEEKVEIIDYANRVIESNNESEDETIVKLSNWMSEKGLSSGEINYELIIEDNNSVIIDIAWPDGIQSNLSEPVAVMLNEDQKNINRVNLKNYRIFTDVNDFKEYVNEKY